MAETVSDYPAQGNQTWAEVDVSIGVPHSSPLSPNPGSPSDSTGAVPDVAWRSRIPME